MTKFDLRCYTSQQFYMVCKTNEEAEIFCNFLHENGREWCDGMPYTESTDFDDISGDVAYYFNTGCRSSAHGRLPMYRLDFSDFDWTQKNKVKTISLSDFEDIINV